MADRKKQLSAIHDWSIEQVLTDLGMYSSLIKGGIKCHCCSRTVSLDDLGGILVLGDDEYAIICSRARCLESASDNKR